MNRTYTELMNYWIPSEIRVLCGCWLLPFLMYRSFVPTARLESWLGFFMWYHNSDSNTPLMLWRFHNPTIWMKLYDGLFRWTREKNYSHISCWCKEVWIEWLIYVWALHSWFVFTANWLPMTLTTTFLVHPHWIHWRKGTGD